ncbi:MAG: YncE family protein [Vulcanimicrobiaceae bacterium]
MQRNYTRLTVIGLWTLLLVGCGGRGGSVLPPTPAPTPLQPMYVAESGLNQVAVLDSATGVIRTTIPVGKGPEKMSSDRSNHIWVVNSGSGTVSKIDAATNSVVATIKVGSTPVSVCATSKVYVANQGSSSVSVIDPATDTVVATVATGGAPFSLACDTRVLPIAETNDTVEFLDPADNAIVGKMTMPAPVAGVVLDFTQAGILTSDGILHLYEPPGGPFPLLDWTLFGTVSMPDGAGPLSNTGTQLGTMAWMVSSQTANAIQGIQNYGSAGTMAKSITRFNVGSAPEYAAQDVSGYTYVPNAGDDSITVVSGGASISAAYKLVATWKLQKGAMPYDVAFPFGVATTASPSPSPAPSPTPTATPTTHLYVANGSAGNVLEYTAPFSSSSAPSVSVTIGGNVWGVASDSKYVAVEDSTGYIYIFNAPLTSGSSPVAQFQQFQGGVGGAQLLFDSNGNLYTGTQGNMVFEYSPPFSNASTPSKTINGDSSSFSLATDYLGNLYVGNLGMNQIDIFASPYTSAPTSVTAPGTYGLASYATYLFDADAMNGVIDVYNLPMNASSTPAYTIANTDPHALAVDETGTLYVGDQHGGTGTGSVDAYAQPLSASSTTAYSITSGLVEPVELWFGP